MRAFSSRNVVLAAMVLALGLAGCASGGGGNRVPGATSNRIVEAELEPLGQIDAYQAIERLRPRWLQVRAGPSGTGPVLYVDGARRGSANDLRTLRIADIEQMEYMSGNDATTRFGTGHGGGAIMVTSRR